MYIFPGEMLRDCRAPAGADVNKHVAEIEALFTPRVHCIGVHRVDVWCYADGNQGTIRHRGYGLFPIYYVTNNRGAEYCLVHWVGQYRELALDSISLCNSTAESHAYQLELPSDVASHISAKFFDQLVDDEED